MSELEQKGLEYAISEITEIAKGFGLDFYPMRYEICPSEIIYTFGAYGMPTRFSHWSFGKQFHKMKLHYDFGLSKIYELVINSNPCYAFLLDSNSLIQNKLIVAHVLAHCDFFKNNIRFKIQSEIWWRVWQRQPNEFVNMKFFMEKRKWKHFLMQYWPLKSILILHIMRPKLSWSIEDEEEEEEIKPAETIR